MGTTRSLLRSRRDKRVLAEISPITSARIVISLRSRRELNEISPRSRQALCFMLVKLYAFEQLFLGVLNEHAPIKQTMIRGNQVPYMTEQWRRAIRHRNKLWKKFTRNRTDENYEAYKTQRNTCTSLRRKAIKQHFARKTADTEHPSEFWSTFRPFLHTKSKQANDIILKENDRIISDKKENVFSAVISSN